jgi:hypothetical protein
VTKRNVALNAALSVVAATALLVGIAPAPSSASFATDSNTTQVHASSIGSAWFRYNSVDDSSLVSAWFRYNSIRPDWAAPLKRLELLRAQRPTGI